MRFLDKLEMTDIFTDIPKLYLAMRAIASSVASSSGCST